jgi:SecD/SecF fusion protein
VKWKDEYNAAQVSIRPGARFDVPKPTRNTILSNLALSWLKYFRGDEKKVIHWGLDLSGGKSVQIELRDANNRIVKNDDDIKQGINELYNRVNKMGVSEVAIRQLGNQIVLDFPGSQSLSASELIKASSMYFHIVNEKFSSPTTSLAASVQRFLQEVWNEAVVTNRKDSQSINAIAWKHLNGEAVSETARTLLENGLKLQSPDDQGISHEIDETISKIALIRGENWFGQTHPLLIVFRNYALEGSQLDRIQSNYDAQKGNSLSFEVKGASLDRQGQKISPRETLHTWTSRFSKEKVLGTSLEDYSKGHGWRMAVLLNDTVINAPTLDAVIRDSASISGSFSQREVMQLAADLKAGSLTFTPHILSEKNVSPELGQQDRSQGIIATVVALLLVIGSMIAYYRFAGLVASVAVIFNLLILWATLQNIGATLSLAGIAGIILTVGMAVDANVLVFERIKEEFALTGRISSAISAGYQKAYSAIVDSNVTTIIAALILLNFDAGPIKGFAITLIIGIVSSMFTALFMTRFYFNGWLRNPKNKVLSMSNWIHSQTIDFLKQAKRAFAIAALIIVVGSYFVYSHRATIFGMDFTGGFSLHLEATPRAEEDYLQRIEQALIEKGATSQDFQIRQLNPSSHLRILFGTSMEQPGKPFFHMPIESEKVNARYNFETNPRIDWVVQTLGAKGITLTEESLDHLETNWTAMSGQMSDSMRNNALIGLLISFICIFIYIAFRFEYKFAAAAIICLLHDVLITIGLMGLIHALGVPVQIDLNTVAAIMTIVGYSLNDTIIIFDRIREEMRLSRNQKLPSIVNHALNATLSRTSITSGTTLLVLIALVALGGSSIFSFALVMTIGVFFGTLSSWYIASPLMLYFHSKEERETLKVSHDS